MMVRKTVLCSGAEAAEQHEWLRSRARPDAKGALSSGSAACDEGPASGALRVRKCTWQDVEEILLIQSLAFEIATPVDEAVFRAVVRRYPAGAICADVDGVIIGFHMAFPTRHERWTQPHTRAEVVDDGKLADFDPEGDALYEVGCAIHPDHQRSDVGAMLARDAAGRATQRGRRGLLSAPRLRGYPRVAARLSPEDYAREVIAGRLQDATLTPALRAGYRPLDPLLVLRGYHDDDLQPPDGSTHGVLMQLEG